MKQYTLLCGLVLCAGAHASYELLMVADSVAKTIKRYDPISGASFGTIGTGYLTAPLSVSMSGGVLYALDQVSAGFGGTRIRKFNPSTGEYLGSFPLSSSWGKSGAGSQLVMGPSGYAYVSDSQVSGSGYVNRYGPGSGAYGTFYGQEGNSFATGVALSADESLVYSAGLSSSKIYWHNSSTGALMGSAPLPASSSPVHMVRDGNRLYVACESPAAQLRVFTIGANGALATAGTYSYSQFGYGAVVGIAVGHNNAVYVSGVTNNTGKLAIHRLDGITGDYMGEFGGGTLSSPFGMAIITAPEPTTLAAWGLGALLLARRRRSR